MKIENILDFYDFFQEIQKWRNTSQLLVCNEGDTKVAWIPSAVKVESSSYRLCEFVYGNHSDINYWPYYSHVYNKENKLWLWYKN